MCSLAGSFGGENKRFIETALAEMSGRGSIVGRYYGGSLSLVSHRLAIIGGATYDMPYAFGNFVTVYNGEIYNYKQLAERYNLSSRAYESDTHCLVEGYAKYGKDFFTHLEGMFAFSIYNRQTQILVLGRDQFGTKPLYAGKAEGVYYFASEIKVFKDTELDEAFIVGPGELFEISASGVQKSRIDYQTPLMIDSFTNLFIDSITKHIPSEKFALLMSGGVDSTLLALYLKSLGADFVGYSARSKNFSADADDAHRLARQLNIEHHIVDFDPERIDVERLVYRMETGNERILYGAAILDQLAKQIAKAGLRIVVDGNGADEVFMGYREFESISPSRLRQAAEEYRTTIFPNAQAQRADRIAGTYQMEGRHPYLFQPFLQWVKQRDVADSKGKKPLLELLEKSPLFDAKTRLLASGKNHQLISGTTGKSSFETYFSDKQRQAIHSSFYTLGFDRFITVDAGESNFFDKYSLGNLSFQSNQQQ